jgi:hypothetical protein
MCFLPELGQSDKKLSDRCHGLRSERVQALGSKNRLPKVSRSTKLKRQAKLKDRRSPTESKNRAWLRRTESASRSSDSLSTESKRCSADRRVSFEANQMDQFPSNYDSHVLRQMRGYFGRTRCICLDRDDFCNCTGHIITSWTNSPRFVRSSKAFNKRSSSSKKRGL